jgi:hypothetical protein
MTDDAVRSKSNWALGWSLAAVPLCCPPLGLVGAFLAFRAIKLARDRGDSTPGKAIAAVVIAIFSLIPAILFAFWGMGVRKEHEGRLEKVRAASAGKRDAPTLERDVACALVVEQLLSGLYQGRTANGATCGGPIEAGPDRMVVKGIDVDLGAGRKARLTGCLARASRWFAISATTGEDCPTGPWAASGVKTEAELKAEEDQLRRTESQRVDTGLARSYTAALVAARDALLATPRKEATCPTLDLGLLHDAVDKRLKLRTVDLQYLAAPADPAPTAETGWSFLTSDDVRVVLDPKAPAADRAAGIRAIVEDGGPYILVYQADHRALPQVFTKKGFISKDLSFAGGRYEGWMVVVDTRTARPLCEARLAFANSAKVKYARRGLSTEEGRLGSALNDDLVTQFKARASEGIKAMSSDQFRLGYKWLE